MQGSKPYTIGFVTDPGLSREKTHLALRALNSLRGEANIRYYPGTITEDDLVHRLSREPVDLLLMPWHIYLLYSRVEAHFGLTRLQGPTVVGYFAEGITPVQIEEQDHHFRSIMIDFNRLSTSETATVLRSLLKDSTRWGIRPHLMRSTSVHYESWSALGGLGFRVDAALELPEISKSQWIKRSNSVRIIMNAFWSLVFDRGPGKADKTRTGLEHPTRAYFEIAADVQTLAIRLCYTEPSWKIKDVLHRFWPGGDFPSSAGQILLHYSDLLRVHVDPETNEIEVVALLYPSAPAERQENEIRSLWIEPMTRFARFERFSEVEAAEEFHKRLETRHDLIGGASEKMNDIKRELEEANETVRDLQIKNAMSETTLIYPNAITGEELLDLFGRKVLESKSKVRGFQNQLQDIKNAGRAPTPSEVGRISRGIRELQSHQRSWISRIADILAGYESDRRKQNFDPLLAIPQEPLSESDYGEEEELILGGHETIDDALAEQKKHPLPEKVTALKNRISSPRTGLGSSAVRRGGRR